MSIGSALNVTSPIPTTGCYMDRSCAHSELQSARGYLVGERSARRGSVMRRVRRGAIKIFVNRLKLSTESHGLLPVGAVL